MATEITESWYSQLIEDCRDIAVETEFASNWALVEGRHLLGSRILQDYEKAQLLRMPDSELVQRIALSIKRSKRTVYYSIQFVRMFPDLNLLPDGKNVRWGHIINKYLTTGEKKHIITKGELMKQIEEIKKLLENRYLEYHQKEVNLQPASYDYDQVKACIKEIRYLQDQINKITGEIECPVD